MSINELIIEGAKQNNLKNINLKLPHNKVITVTGVSGSGKSSLAFDTIFAEGQWRFIESLSPYVRLFLEKLDRPDVESIRNIRPAIALEQHNPVRGSRSTVGTATEMYDYLRLLYAKIAQPHCLQCGRLVKTWNPSSVVKELTEKYYGKKALILFSTDDTPGELQKKGFHRVLIQGKTVDISSLISRPPSLNVVLDRLTIKNDPRLADSVETAWRYGGQGVTVEIIGTLPEKNKNLVFLSALRCLHCNPGIRDSVSSREINHNRRELPIPQPLLFSFNHPLGACPACKGFGNTLEYSEEYIVPDQDLSIEKGAIEPWSKPAYRWWYRQFVKAAKARGVKLKIPYKDLTRKTRDLIFRGGSDFYGLNDFFRKLENKRYKLHVRVFLSRYRKAVICKQCNGSRLRPEARAFTVAGVHIADLMSMSISELNNYFSELHLSDYEQKVSSEIRRQIEFKLHFLMRVELGYLTLDRLSKTLSGGESQRISLSNQLASKLTGTLYVLDEPTIGLHPVDVSRVTDIIRELADIGNTIIVVEHDKKVINSSDWIVELGPGGGRKGGNLLFSGTKEDFLKSNTLTAKYLHGVESVSLPEQRRKGKGRSLFIKQASGHNLKKIDINIPLQTMVCVTGVSGSGKSTLVKDTLYKVVAKAFKTELENPLPLKSVRGLEYLKGVRIIDQQPIGKSPRSNPVTYMKAFDPIRKLFAEQAHAKNLGYGPGHFSFNVEGGRCEVCRGDGLQRLEMYFFEDLYITCEECKGKRYKPKILTVTCNGKNIHQVLQLTVEEALEFFRAVPLLKKKLKLMDSVGLGYLRLGQPATTLSGGEAQRLKICAELGIANRRDYLYILDEPTIGLHTEDIKKLLRVLNELVTAGNSVLLVEHNLDVIKSADWIIDLGPDGGEKGGEIVAEGPPEHIIKQENSHTGLCLKEYLKG